MLDGVLHAHASIGSIQRILTSNLIAIDPKSGWARTTSGFYRLGQAAPWAESAAAPPRLSDVPAIATDNVALRERFVLDIACHTLAEIVAMGLDPDSGRLLGVPYGSDRLFPQFQIVARRPLPIIGLVLAALPQKMSTWRRAMWFVSPNPLLDDAAPHERLDEPGLLLAAAEKLAREVSG